MHPLHERAVILAKTYRTTEGELLSTLMEMAVQNLFIKMGFTGMWEYLIEALKISESQASYFQRVAQRARAIPQLRDAVVSERVSLSQARRIVGVIDEKNHGTWISMAEKLTQKDLEKAVAEVSPRRGVREGMTVVAKDLSKLTAVLTAEQEEELRRVMHLVSQSLRKSASVGETISAMTKLYLEKNDPVKRAERASAASRNSSTSSRKVAEIHGLSRNHPACRRRRCVETIESPSRRS